MKKGSALGPQLQSGAGAQSHGREWEELHIEGATEGSFSFFLRVPCKDGSRTAGQRPGLGRLQTFRVKLCISGQWAGPWELPSMLNQTVITNKSRSAWALWGALEPHHAGPFHLASLLLFRQSPLRGPLNKKLKKFAWNFIFLSTLKCDR